MKLWWLPLVVLSAGCASSQPSATESTLPLEEYRFLGNHLVCRTKYPDDPNACYRIGTIKIGAAYEPKVAPQKEVTLPNGVIASMFPIIKNDQHEAYWILGHKNGKVVSIQLTGNYPSADYALASIRLGDSEEKVARVLGPRHNVKEVKEIGGVLWDYYPFSISIELVGGKVYSMRVVESL